MYKKSKNLAADMLPKSFKAPKCKTELKLAMSRMKLMKNKKEIQVKQMRRDLAPLLEAGQDQTARIRVEHVIREEKTLAAYELIDIYCELIVARLSIIESQKLCPIDLKEAISGVIFASPRCADVPELMDVRKQFAAKYGKEFVTAALEVRPECGVSRILVEKLSARAPDVETKTKVLTSIAEEHNIKWDPKSFEDQYQKNDDDFLAGPNTFTSAHQMPMRYSDHNSSSTPVAQQNFSSTPVAQQNFSSTPVAQQSSSSTPDRINEPRMNDVVGKPSSFKVSSGSAFNASNIPQQFTQPESRISESRESRSGKGELNSVYQENRTALNGQNWNMEFEDAASAAQAAAECAERANMAARAAAEFANRENVLHGTRVSKSDSQKVTVETDVKEPVPVQHYDMKQSQESRTKMEDTEMDEVEQVSSNIVGEKGYDGYARVPRTSSRPPSNPSVVATDEEFMEVNQKVDDRPYHHAQKGFFNAEPLAQDHKDTKNKDSEYVQGVINRKHSNSFAINPFSNDSILDSNIQKHESYGENSGAGPAPIFDDYGSETYVQSIFDRPSSGNLWGSLSAHQGEHSRFLSSKDPSSPKLRGSASLVKNRSSELTERDPSEYFETAATGKQSPRYTDDFPTRFDDPHGQTSDSEDVFEKIMREEAIEPSDLQHNQAGSSRGLLSTENDRKSDRSLSLEKKEVGKDGVYNLVLDHTDASEKNLGSFAIQRKGSGSYNLSGSQSIPNENSPRNSNNLEREVFYSPRDEKLLPRQVSRVPSLEAETDSSLRMTSQPQDVDDAHLSNNSENSSGDGLGFSKLTGGFKNKGLPRPPYWKVPQADISVPQKQTSINTTSTQEPANTTSTQEPAVSQEKSTVSYPSKISVNSEKSVYESQSPRLQRNGNKEHSLESHVHSGTAVLPPKASMDASVAVEKSDDSVPGSAYSSFESPKRGLLEHRQSYRTRNEPSSTVQLQNFDKDGAQTEVLETRDIAGRKGSRFTNLSRRTRDQPAGPKSSSLSRFPIRSDAPDEMETRPTQARSVSETSKSRDQSIHLEEGKSSEASLPKLSPEQSSAPPSKAEAASVLKGNLKTSQGNAPGDVARTESPNTPSSSGKSAPHVHPKLPDYDSFAAHFRALRANRREQ